MGLLVEGSPLDWPDALEWLQHVRTQGIDQFLHTYNRVKDIEGDELKWGDELEYGVFHMDKETKRVRLALRGAEILQQLQAKEKKSKDAAQDQTSTSPRGADSILCVDGCSWVPEYGAWMIEGTPSMPYGGFTSDLRKVEGNMRLRRARLLALLKEDEIAPSVTAFPMMGVGDFTVPSKKSRPSYDSKKGVASNGLSSPYGSAPTSPSSTSNSEDNAEAMAKSPKATTILDGVQNECDPKNVLQNISKAAEVVERKPEPYPGFIHMDAMAFGMGMCCLQVTFQAKNVGESRHLYDHLGVLSPILLALTAATPILKGRLADTDVRWATISAAVDDRTPQELGETSPPTDEETKEKYAHMAGNGIKRLPKSRYEGISTFICNHKQGEDPHTSTDKYNDVEVPYDDGSYDTLIKAGVDRLLALHISHLFIRDPLVIYQQRLHLDNEHETDHFENIQSTNWQTVRWKPPPPAPSNAEGPHIGWRTEFRSMEIQLTDFENAAFTVFIALVSRVILTFDLNLYVPLSNVNDNMEAAHRVNAVLDEKFHFRCHMAPPEVDDCCSEGSCHLHEDPDASELMTIAEIMLGKGSYFPGLIPLVYAYLDYIECDEATRTLVQKYMCLIAKRATGELPTAATWMRRFVRSHADYRHDSVVPHSTAFDLLTECQQIGEGLKQCPELLGEFKIAPVRGEAAYSVPLKSSGVAAEKRQVLLQRYLGRTASSHVCDN
ncbi:hypothetical protein BBO99_00007997 [Phytophthora kernoviae]|uniref:Glutamate--cysteine ligase n=1 Tax=Phytophthora kernoviae TaxID=325452 RepID=A0A3R7K931_9STRA|nr:hypothetical protein JM16_007642 [Phytophthora kernoviae]KAG2519424.1 hypothetical protein JM18_007547 [Phytophthora kernoviae]RLN37301.1 hypothetical protein BBI17_007948 [Phytophthora kernoviae]RLN75869.1 hypothetical protein BBO99_00007997 [Phytophthora kernoviae]